MSRWTVAVFMNLTQYKTLINMCRTGKAGSRFFGKMKFMVAGAVLSKLATGIVCGMMVQKIKRKHR